MRVPLALHALLVHGARTRVSSQRPAEPCAGLQQAGNVRDGSLILEQAEHAGEHGFARLHLRVLGAWDPVLGLGAD